MDKLFENKTVLISGGLGDIGRATALEFARRGANIAIGDLQPAGASTKFLAELEPYKHTYTYTTVDVTDANAVKQWIDKVEVVQGVASIIIANAAIVTLAGIHELTPQQWSRELRVNLDGAFHVSQMATARLVHHQQPGRVVFVGSWAGHAPHVHIPAYCVSKAGLRMLCQCMALELAPHNILVNEIAPGYVNAGLTGAIWKDNPGRDVIAIQKVPIKKVITAQQVAEQIANLCRPENEHMTGSTILMDGGLSLLS